MPNNTSVDNATDEIYHCRVHYFCIYICIFKQYYLKTTKLRFEDMLEWLFGKKKQQPVNQVQQPKRKKKSQVQQQTQDRWQYQFLLQFLNSPLWRVSILDFVDNNCIVFDNQEENKFEYTKIHNEFKELVATLFDGMMEEVGLDGEKLEALLIKGFQSKQKKLFNQLLLCDDFLKFKQLMVKRNKALEEQAIKAMNGQQRKPNMIQKQRNFVHSSMKQQQKRRRKIQQQQEQQLRKALELSKIQSQQSKVINKIGQKAEDLQNKRRKQQQQQDQKRRKAEAERIKKQKQQEQLSRTIQRIKQQQRQEARRQQQRQKQQQQRKRQAQQKQRRAQKLKQIKARQSKNLSDLPPLKAPIKKQADPQPPVIEPAIIEPPVVEQPAVVEQAKGQSIEQRKKRLLEQREKIRKKKQQQRKKMLEQQESQNAKKTVNIVLQDQGIHDSVAHHEEEKEKQKVSKDQIERRKQIMKKIKNRIVDDF